MYLGGGEDKHEDHPGSLYPSPWTSLNPHIATKPWPGQRQLDSLTESVQKIPANLPHWNHTPVLTSRTENTPHNLATHRASLAQILANFSSASSYFL